MKTLRSIATALTGLAVACAAASTCEIPLTVAPAEEGNVVPAAAVGSLNAKLKNLVARMGIAGIDGSQFFLTARFDTGYSERTSGPTPAEYVNTTLTLFIGDAEGKKIFSSLSLDLKGVGVSEEQAYKKAIATINPNRADLKEFVEKGKRDIIAYYDSNYPSILTKARNAMTARNYDEAIYYACMIPECCRGYNDALGLINTAMTERRDYDSARLLAEARAAWGADPTADGAREALGLISGIDPASPSFGAAQALTREISSTVREDWVFENVTKYKDELALRKRALDNQASVEKARIESARAVAVAWAKSRPATRVYHYYRWY